ncbi:hypothetical protein PR048_030717 [Dryococelus australis]|uniref:Uncharacterized protein n=1 Tax=Dryococelus australis TaxID=614101 RepID=A0ABQ9G9P9_9NEOP|nr:hypothetical protein PR048_030717 [Dryococelus australis]
MCFYSLRASIFQFEEQAVGSRTESVLATGVDWKQEQVWGVPEEYWFRSTLACTGEYSVLGPVGGWVEGGLLGRVMRKGRAEVVFLAEECRGPPTHFHTRKPGLCPTGSQGIAAPPSLTHFPRAGQLDHDAAPTEAASELRYILAYYIYPWHKSPRHPTPPPPPPGQDQIHPKPATPRVNTVMSQHSGQTAVPNDPLKNSGHGLENRDCPEKSGLTLAPNLINLDRHSDSTYAVTAGDRYAQVCTSGEFGHSPDAITRAVASSTPLSSDRASGPPRPAVAWRIERSLPPRRTLVRSPAVPFPDFRTWETWHTLPSIGWPVLLHTRQYGTRYLFPCKSAIGSEPSRAYTESTQAGRCRWLAGFLGDLPFPPPFHSSAAPYSPQSPSSALKTSMLRAVQISSLTSLTVESALCTAVESSLAGRARERENGGAIEREERGALTFDVDVCCYWSCSSWPTVMHRSTVVAQRLSTSARPCSGMRSVIGPEFTWACLIVINCDPIAERAEMYAYMCLKTSFVCPRIMDVQYRSILLRSTQSNRNMSAHVDTRLVTKGRRTLKSSMASNIFATYTCPYEFGEAGKLNFESSATQFKSQVAEEASVPLKNVDPPDWSTMRFPLPTTEIQFLLIDLCGRFPAEHDATVSRNSIYALIRGTIGCSRSRHAVFQRTLVQNHFSRLDHLNFYASYLFASESRTIVFTRRQAANSEMKTASVPMGRGDLQNSPHCLRRYRSCCCLHEQNFTAAVYQAVSLYKAAKAIHEQEAVRSIPVGCSVIGCSRIIPSWIGEDVGATGHKCSEFACDESLLRAVRACVIKHCRGRCTCVQLMHRSCREGGAEPGRGREEMKARCSEFANWVASVNRGVTGIAWLLEEVVEGGEVCRQGHCQADGRPSAAYSALAAFALATARFDRSAVLPTVHAKAVHDKVSTFETNLRKKSLSLPAYILTVELRDMRPVNRKIREFNDLKAILHSLKYNNADKNIHWLLAVTAVGDCWAYVLSHVPYWSRVLQELLNDVWTNCNSNLKSFVRTGQFRDFLLEQARLQIHIHLCYVCNWTIVTRPGELRVNKRPVRKHASNPVLPGLSFGERSLHLMVIACHRTISIGSAVGRRVSHQALIGERRSHILLAGSAILLDCAAGVRRINSRFASVLSNERESCTCLSTPNVHDQLNMAPTGYRGADGSRSPYTPSHLPPLARLLPKAACDHQFFQQCSKMASTAWLCSDWEGPACHPQNWSESSIPAIPYTSSPKTMSARQDGDSYLLALRLGEQTLLPTSTPQNCPESIGTCTCPRTPLTPSKEVLPSLLLLVGECSPLNAYPKRFRLTRCHFNLTEQVDYVCIEMEKKITSP